jgi:ribose transport system substrate-binding protein
VKLITAGSRRSRAAWAATALLALGAVAAGGAAGGSTAKAAKPVRIAYLSFAVANSYDAPMLAAAKAVAKAQGGR